MRFGWLLLTLIVGCSETPRDGDPVVGPRNGTLVAIGGNTSDGHVHHFVELAGGYDVPIVVIPTPLADDDPLIENLDLARAWYEDLGMTDVHMLHTRDRDIANSDAFVEPLRTARGVFFEGGRQWRVADAYLDTLTQVELLALLDRGGVIGGSSAGAVLQGSFLFRGDTSGIDVLLGDHQIGLGFLKGVGLDTHVAERGRELDLIAMVEAHPELLGIGIDEDTAITVTGDVAVVRGAGNVHIHDYGRWPAGGSDEDKVFRLSAGDRYDLHRRQTLK